MEHELQITISRDAKRIIAGFTAREKELYDYIIELFKSDSKNMQEIDIAMRAGDDASVIRIGWAKIIAMNDRAAFIMQCFRLFGNVTKDHIIINTLNDKL